MQLGPRYPIYSTDWLSPSPWCSSGGARAACECSGSRVQPVRRGVSARRPTGALFTKRCLRRTPTWARYRNFRVSCYVKRACKYGMNATTTAKEVTTDGRYTRVPSNPWPPSLFPSRPRSHHSPAIPWHELSRLVTNLCTIWSSGKRHGLLYVCF